MQSVKDITKKKLIIIIIIEFKFDHVIKMKIVPSVVLLSEIIIHSNTKNITH